MAISSDEAVAEARDFANKVGWLTLSRDVREHSRPIPSLWQIHFVGGYQDFEINVDTETGESFHQHCQSLLQITISKILEHLPKDKEGKPLHTVEAIAEEHNRAYQKWEERTQHTP